MLNRTRLLLILLVVDLLPLPAAAQSERQIAGVVRHAETYLPLADVTVTAGEGRTITDRDGRFELRVPAGVVQVEASAPEFYSLSTQVDVTATDASETELLLVPRTGFASTVDVVAAPPPASAPSAVVVTPAEVLRTETVSRVYGWPVRVEELAEPQGARVPQVVPLKPARSLIP